MVQSGTDADKISRNWFLLLLDKKILEQAATKKKSPPEKIMKKQPWGDLFCCVLWFPRTFIFPNQKKTPLPSSFLLDPTGNSLQFRRLRLPTRPNRASSITDCFGGGREGGRGTVFPKDFGVSEIPFRPWVGLGFLIAWPRLTFRFIPFFFILARNNAGVCWRMAGACCCWLTFSLRIFFRNIPVAYFWARHM